MEGGAVVTRTLAALLLVAVVLLGCVEAPTETSTGGEVPGPSVFGSSAP